MARRHRKAALGVETELSRSLKQLAPLPVRCKNGGRRPFWAISAIFSHEIALLATVESFLWGVKADCVIFSGPTMTYWRWLNRRAIFTPRKIRALRLEAELFYEEF
jgi:hypothetical protein